MLEVTTSYLQGEYGVEIRIKSVNKDHSHSWGRISHGLNKLVTNLNNKEQDDTEQETSEVQFEEYALKLNTSDFACRSKAKAKPQRREPASSSIKTIPIGTRIWTDVEPGENSISNYELSKKLITLLRHGSLLREDDGAIESCRIKDHLQSHFVFFFVMVMYLEKMMERLNSGESKTIFRNTSCIVIIGLTTSGRRAWQEEEETRKDASIVLIRQEQSCSSELFKVIQDAVSLIMLYTTMLLFRATSSNTFTLSDVQSGIDTWRSKFEQQTDSILSACGSHGRKP